jgi:hypothetical protein
MELVQKYSQLLKAYQRARHFAASWGTAELSPYKRAANE